MRHLLSPNKKCRWPKTMVTASFSHCDSNSFPTTTKATTLTPNQFHKLCPAQYSSGTTLGQPQCGDGSAFSFFFSRPPVRLENEHKLLIEFQGGGACWDSNTCGMQKDYLTFPPYYDDFVGKSCSEIEYGMQNSALGMLCAKEMGSTNFQEYNTIIVPYCTQDVHIGDSFISYDEDDGGGGDNTIRHAGAHNMYRTLQWIFDNFHNPTHIFLTGCSAGGTAVPIAYDLINKHYNTFLKGSGTWPRAVNINVIMDSSVYLTPEYFLQNYYGNWNPATIMKKIQFNWKKYQYNQNYPDIMWDHILRRGPNSDRWGFVTHSDDPISLMYFQYMSGNANNNNRRSLASLDSNNLQQLPPQNVQSHRKLGDDDQSLWWSGIQSSMTFIKKKHNKNVDFYIIDGEGHCSFGLYYPLQDEGFERWASPIVKESVVVGNKRPSAASFLTSIVLGGLSILLIRTAASQKNQGKLLTDDTFGTDANATRMPAASLRIKGIVLHQASKYSSYPWTASYLLTTTIYFICMLLMQGFAHPLENPALGPPAVGLSSFGINNPALIVYKMEHYRLVTSTFLCSGILTYLLVLHTMYKKGAALESALMENMQPHYVFLLVGIIISMGVNLLYVFIGKGASCTSLALVIGLNAFSGVLQRRSPSSCAKSYPVSSGLTILLVVIGSSPLFPFDTILALCASLMIGSITALLLFERSQSEVLETKNEMSKQPSTYMPEKKIASRWNLFKGKGQSQMLETEDDNAKEPSTYTLERREAIRWPFVKGTGIVYFTMYLLVLFRVPSPNKNNIHPYLTGCSLVYSDQIGDFVEKYASNYRRRELGGNEDLFGGQNVCAQLCVPHLVYRPVLWGVRKFGLIELEAGSCEENGYDVHIADKTVREYTVTLEAQVFTQSEE